MPTRAYTARILLGLVLTASLAALANSAEYYIAPGGSNAGAGSIDAPWGTFDFAIDRLDSGDTLWVRGGTFDLNSRVRFEDDHGGSSENPVRVWAYPGEAPVLDFDSMTTGWGGSSGRGVQIDDGADWLHLKGLTIQNARDNGIWSGANNGVFEQLVTRWNGDSGLQLSGFASNNLILNSDSYENYDPSNNGENADGFAIKFEDLGPGNVVRGSRAWGNSDDGWDMWESTEGGVLVEDSWAWDNGKIIPLFYEKEELELSNLSPESFEGDGNGFKLGQDGGPHVLNRVLVWENAVRGIDVNGNGYGVTVNNSTVYNSERNWQFDEEASETLNQHTLRNNISFAGQDSDNFDSGVTDSFNTWNGVRVSAEDFLSLDDTIARGPRQGDGSLPVSDFLRLAPGSNLIDAGVDVGLPYSGVAPDLGAFESTAKLLGDFNDDGQVDARDYALWRDGLASGEFTAADYNDWRGHYGTASGAALGSPTGAPEPGGLTLLAWAASAALRGRRSLARGDLQHDRVL